MARSTIQAQPSPQTPGATRYPSSLSQAPTGGPSRPIRQYPSPSIDSEIGSPPSTSLHEYSSLADLLQQAGYKETRVYTPEAEKVRSRTRIRKNFEEDDDEVNALYGTYGFDRQAAPASGAMGGKTIQHKHITEPSMPMKRSSSILRSLAIQDAADRGGGSDLSQQSSSASTPDHSWWTNWGRATKVISPDAGNTSFEAGLGLAKGGEGVRKVKSTWELERSRPRRAGTDSPQQEERPPMPRTPSAPNDPYSSATGYTPTKPSSSRPIKNIFASPPPPRAIEEDAYGYCPLPEDYEAQCTEDEMMYAMGVNDLTDIYSLGSTTASEFGMSRTPSVQSKADSEVRGSSFESDEFLNEVNEVGKRLMIGALEYDETLDFESPPTQVSPLPAIDDISHAPTGPLPSPPEEQYAAKPAEAVKKPLKYGDRATRLRLAHSTPALKQSAAVAPPLPEGWLGAIRSTFLGKSCTLPTTSGPSAPAPNPLFAPIRISAVTPALPTLVTASPVICDSTSTEAVDLPPVPTPRIQVTAPSAMSNIALRLRPSLARLRDVVLGAPAEESVDDGTSPVLSPRLDWGTQGEQFAGWSPARRRQDIDPNHNEGGVDALFGLGTSASEIDYTRSFFYKPGTPRRAGTADPEVTPTTPPRSGTVTSTNANDTANTESHAPARRQRSIKSLRAALLLPVAPSPVPPVPAIPPHLMTPKQSPVLPPPMLAIQSPGAWEPRVLVLEGEEWDARDGGAPGDWGRKGRSKARSGLKKRRSKKGLQRD